MPPLVMRRRWISGAPVLVVEKSNCSLIFSSSIKLISKIPAAMSTDGSAENAFFAGEMIVKITPAFKHPVMKFITVFYMLHSIFLHSNSTRLFLPTTPSDPVF